MNVPNWYEAILLALASWRTWKLLAEDDILDRPRRYVTQLGKGWKEGDPVPKSYRFGVAEFLSCEYCAGFWVAVGWWGAFQLWGHGTLVAASVMAVSALVPLVNRAAGD